MFGGKDDGVNEMAESLYLRDPIKFIGKVKRNDISFDINKNNEELNATETSVRKTQDLKEKIKIIWILKTNNKWWWIDSMSNYLHHHFILE